MQSSLIDGFIRRWNELAVALGINVDDAEMLRTYLCSQYSGADRHYHDMRHIVCMLKNCDRLNRLFQSPDATALAIFFHDVIYEPARRDNEERSARVMMETLQSIVDHTVLSRAEFAILATKQHLKTDDGDVNLMLDFDIYVLGQEWPVYERYACGVMHEFVPVCGEQAYREGRVKLFLEPTIARGQIFITEMFKELDGPAIRNMQSEIGILKSGASFYVADPSDGC